VLLNNICLTSIIVNIKISIRQLILPVLLGGQEMYVAVKRADANGAGIILGLNRELVREQLAEGIVEEKTSTAYIIIGIIILIIGIVLLVGYIIYKRDKTKQIEPVKWVGNFN